MDNLDLAKLHTAQRKDPAMQSLIEFLETKSENDPKAQYKLISGVLHEHKKDGSLVLLVPYTMITDVLSLFHDGSTTVHMASDRMYALMRKRFSWPNMHADISAYVQACLICNKFKKPLQNKNGLLIPIITRKPMEMIAMDIISMHETENNNKHVLVCVDLFTSWVEATPLKSLEAEEVIAAFFKIFISRHGCPEKVLTDLGSQFTSNIFQSLCQKFKIQHLTSSAYHHQSNGKVERFNRFLKQALSTITNPEQSNWDQLIERCLFVYRISLNKTLNDSPFHLIYGRDAILPYDLCFNNPTSETNNVSPADYVADLIETLRKAYEKLNKHKDLYQQNYKDYYDKSHKEISFNINDLCMIFFPVAKKSLSQKLLPKYDGPFRVIKQLDQVTFRVQSTKPGEEKRIFVTHVQRMLKYKAFEPRSTAEIKSH
jgi:hypothetical protein